MKLPYSKGIDKDIDAVKNNARKQIINGLEEEKMNKIKTIT